jgi:membrane protein required for colicin V production
MAVNWIDAFILGLIGFSALMGLWRGLIREVLSLAIWTLALLLAWRYHPLLAPELAPWLAGETSRLAAAFALLALGGVLVGGLIGYLLTSLVELAGLKGTTRLLGGLFGLIRGVLIVAMLAFLVALTPLNEQPVWQDSRLIGRFQVLAQRVLAEVPPEVEKRVRDL